MQLISYHQCQIPVPELLLLVEEEEESLEHSSIVHFVVLMERGTHFLGHKISNCEVEDVPFA